MLNWVRLEQHTLGSLDRVGADVSWRLFSSFKFWSTLGRLTLPLQGPNKVERTLALVSDYTERLGIPHLSEFAVAFALHAVKLTMWYSGTLDHNDTYTNFSTFVTAHFPDKDYMEIMQKIGQDPKRLQAVKLAEERDRYELNLVRHLITTSITCVWI